MWRRRGRRPRPGGCDEARDVYERAIAASPDSPFLYRELAGRAAQGRPGRGARRTRRRRRSSIPTSARKLVTLGEILEAQGDYATAAEAYGAALALEPDAGARARASSELRDEAALAAMPAEYRAIETSPTVTRAQLAALLGVRLDALLKRRAARNAGRDHRHARQLGGAVDHVGDARGRDGGLSEPHLPAEALVRRVDLAPAGQPRAAARRRRAARRWQTPGADARAPISGRAAGASELSGRVGRGRRRAS